MHHGENLNYLLDAECHFISVTLIRDNRYIAQMHVDVGKRVQIYSHK